MTREEAIEWLDDIKNITENWSQEVAIDMAIEALKAPTESTNTPTNTPTDLISIQMAIEHWGRSSGNLTNDQIAELQREIESLPSADAVEVVRCKDCRHSRIEGDTTLFMWCGYWNKPTDGNRYCSDGKR